MSSCTQQNSFHASNGLAIDLNNSDKLGVVCMFITPDCPLSQAYAKSFSKLALEYQSEFTFFACLPGVLYPHEEIEHFIDSFNFRLPIVVDSSLILTNRWDAEITPQFFVVDNRGKIKYDGSIDNWAIDLAQKRLAPSEFYLKDALEELKNDREVTISHTDAIGCFIEK